MTKHEPPDSTNPSEIEALIARFEDGQLGVEDRRLICLPSATRRDIGIEVCQELYARHRWA